MQIRRGRRPWVIGSCLKITVSLALAFVAASTALPHASEVDLPGPAGHPRSRFLLPLYVSPVSERKLDAVLQRAIDDWNVLFRESLGVEAFSRSAVKDQAAIQLAVRPSPSGKLMGQTELDVDDVIRPPVKITLSPPKARGRLPPTWCSTGSRHTNSAMHSVSRTAQSHGPSCAAFLAA